MAIPDYCVVGQLPHIEDVYLVTRKLTLPDDHVFVLKYTGSSFLYPEPYYNVSLQHYLELRQPNDLVLTLILSQLQDICVKYHIEPKDMLSDGVTFNHNENRFMYPKQLIGYRSMKDSSEDRQGQTPFEVIKEYLGKNQRDSKGIDEIIRKIVENKGYVVEEEEGLKELFEKKEQEEKKEDVKEEIEEDVCKDIEVLQDGDRTPELHGSEDEDQKQPEVANNNDIEKEANRVENTSKQIQQPASQVASAAELKAQYLQKQLHISDEEELAKIILSQRQAYQSSVVFSFLETKKEIQVHSPDDKQLLDLFDFATLYKKIGQHKLAKVLFGYFHKVMTEVIQRQQEVFEREEPKIVYVKLDVAASNKKDIFRHCCNVFVMMIWLVIEWVRSLKQDLKEDLEGLLTIQIEQHSAEWSRQRKLRVTASNFGNIFRATTIEKLQPKLQRYQDRKNEVMDQLFPKFFGNSATQYGTDTESEARDKYVSLHNDQEYIVKEFGLIVDKRFPWIAGSPDGIVYQHGKRIGCLEIKCPYSMRDSSIVENYEDIGFLEKSNETGCVCLKKTHVYYSQCQGIMRLSGVLWCDFFVYSKVDYINIRVEYDEVFMNTLIMSLNHYYFGHLLVELMHPCQSIHIEQQVLHEEIQEMLEDSGYDFEEIQKDRKRQEEGERRGDEENGEKNDKENINGGGDTEKEEDNDNDEDSHGTQALEEGDDDNGEENKKKNNSDGTNNKNNNNPTQELIESSQEIDLGFDDQDGQQQGLNEEREQSLISSDNHNNNGIDLADKPASDNNRVIQNDSVCTQPLDNESNDDDTQPLDEE